MPWQQVYVPDDTVGNDLDVIAKNGTRSAFRSSVMYSQQLKPRFFLEVHRQCRTEEKYKRRKILTKEGSERNPTVLPSNSSVVEKGKNRPFQETLTAILSVSSRLKHRLTGIFAAGRLFYDEKEEISHRLINWLRFNVTKYLLPLCDITLEFRYCTDSIGVLKFANISRIVVVAFWRRGLRYCTVRRLSEGLPGTLQKVVKLSVVFYELALYTACRKFNSFFFL